ncbi:DEAD/DEAH box helicase [Corynebacterium sp. 13CS0277]|uniref:DEAD/DEAH box helicase n=1 Tax=Corynebacterium sp. 13CS0277 TaxID=2071994 RepID=UPI001304C883|nr:DEAD/DEAH box helicase [Corynebacterium sp. 13CS0277]
MSQLLPSKAVTSIVDGITEYLTTTVALADASAAAAFESFVKSEASSMFHGPYVRTRMPFVSAQVDVEYLGWTPPGFTPYTHQQQAYQRLRSWVPGEHGGAHEPEPTVIVTGTGSGKTEAFLHPIIDHVVRVRRNAQEPRDARGVKALILYPMNALANDQAVRLAKLLSEDSRLEGVTAGLYTGEADADDDNGVLMTSRHDIRKNPPDILLTNYKMLDQLLLREADQVLWEISADSLQYVVLDEAHTYDGAQGTDVAMLLRRMGLKLKHFSGSTDPRPLGKVTPVATSATIGDQSDMSELLSFARAIFGREFTDESVVRETRQSVADWAGRIDPQDYEGAAHFQWHEVKDQVEDFNAAIAGFKPENSGAKIHAAYDSFSDARDLDSASYAANAHGIYADIDERIDAATSPFELSAAAASRLKIRVMRDPWLLRLLYLTQQPKALDVLAREFFGLSTAAPDSAVEFMANLVAELSFLRAQLGRTLPSVDVHVWVRELSRIDRSASPEISFRWSDDHAAAQRTHLAFGEDEEAHVWLPAIYCRHCSRSGWMTALGPSGGYDDLTFAASRIRSMSVSREDKARTRPLILAQSDTRTPEATSQLYWLDIAKQKLDPVTAEELTAAGSDEGHLSEERAESVAGGRLLQVLTFSSTGGAEAAVNETCPACGQDDGIRYIGSAVATLLSVAVSNLFGLPDVDDAEKKALIFTDSVQDAAHRAGFVEHRSHAFGLRTKIACALSEDEYLPLSQVAEQLFESNSDTPVKRFQLLPPDLSQSKELEALWDPSYDQDPNSAAAKRARRMMKDRILFDICLEFGLRSNLGRTLMLTGTADAHVDAGTPEDLLRCAKAAFATFNEHAQQRLDGMDSALDEARGLNDAARDAQLLAWARSILERIRSRGGVHHEWLRDYMANDGNYYQITRAQNRGVAIQSFHHTSVPHFPRLGKAVKETKWKQGIDAAAHVKGWYARWTARQLGMSTEDAAHLVYAFLEHAEHAGILLSVESSSNSTTGRVFAIPHDKVLVRKMSDAQLADRNFTDPDFAGPKIAECNVCHSLTACSAETLQQILGARCYNNDCEGHLVPFAVRPNYYRDMYRAATRRSIIAREHTSLLEKEKRARLERTFRGAGDVDAPDAVNVLVATPTLEMGIDIGDLSTVFLSSMPRSVANYVQRVGRAGRLTGNALIIAIVQGRGQHLPQVNNPLSMIDGDVQPPAVFLNAREIVQRQAFAAVVDDLSARGKLSNLKDARDVFSPTSGLKVRIDEVAPEIIAAARDRFLESFGDLLDGGVKDFVRTWDMRQTLALAGDTWQAERKELIYLKQKLAEKEKELTDKALAPAATEQMREDAKLTTSAIRRAAATLKLLETEYWISSLERFGQLPNYTLLDDSVELQVSGVQRGSDGTIEFLPKHKAYSRALSSALTELAPGNHFYAEGLRIRIDAVELGENANRVEKWRTCPMCSFTAVYGATNTQRTSASDSTVADYDRAACPECGATAFAGLEAVIDVLPMQKVSAQVRLERDIIDGARERRERQHYTTSLSVQLPEKKERTTWFFADSDFGVSGLPNVTLKWMNLGTGQGTERIIHGQSIHAPLFTVCRQCGQVDNNAGKNDASDHRGWCPNKDESEQDNLILAIGRTLTTQGVLMYLPSDVFNFDSYALPSLIAALKMGFRQVLGGDPQHLDVSVVSVPSPVQGSNDVEEALLIHDNIPGGTGYLTAFTDPQRVWELLRSAHETVRTCTCKDSQRGACPDCLLPFADPHQLQYTDRHVAEAILYRLLTGDTLPSDGATGVREITALDANKVVYAPTRENTAESHLEREVRKALTERLESHGAKVTKDVQGSYVTTTFTLPDQEVSWLLEPQPAAVVNEAGTLPDFLLSTTAGERGPRFAIYCDGYAFHATAHNNRVADDATKRDTLRHLGYIPWAVTNQDLTEFREKLALEDTALWAEGWFYTDAAAKRLTQVVNISEKQIRSFLRDSLSCLVDLMKEFQLSRWDTMRAAAEKMQGLPLITGHMSTDNGQLRCTVDKELINLTLDNLPESMDEMRQLRTTLTLTIDVERPSWKEQWITWLRLSNLLSLRRLPADITTRSTNLAAPKATGLLDELRTPAEEPTPVTSDSVTADAAAPVATDDTATDTGAQVAAATESAPAPDVDPQWEELEELAATPAEEFILRALSSAQVPVPVQGEEPLGDQMLDLAWLDAKVGFTTTPEEDYSTYIDAGWTIITADEDSTDDAIAQQLASLLSTHTQRD